MGRHRFSIRQIAHHAGVSEATVDRVLHERPGVRESTRAVVAHTIDELGRQQDAFELGGRLFAIDLVMHTPRRFSSAVWDAFQAAIPRLQPARFTIRAHLHERIGPGELAKILDDVAERGSHAVILKAPDTPEVGAAVERLASAGIPVITLVTDLPTTSRLAYVGIDNRSAGATAAYLMEQWLARQTRDPTILLTTSSHRFRGEEERELGFQNRASAIAPNWQTVRLEETEGLDATVADQVAPAAAEHRIDAVYSMGGGNRAILQTLADAGQHPSVYIAHDLDAENRELLADGELSIVLHHDLDADADRACQLVMAAHGAVPGGAPPKPAAVQVVTPHNLPERALRARR